MSETTDRFVIESGSGTVAYIIHIAADRADSRFSLGLSGPGEKMCSRGNRHPGDRRIPFSEFVAQHDIDKEEFVDFLKDKHSNRPAFLDELGKAGF